MVDPIPQDYPRLLSYITPRDASEAIRFYTDVFGATERMRMDGPDGRIGHAELQFGDSVLMLSEEPGDVMTGYQAPSTLGGTTFAFTMYVEDVDETYRRALAAGAKSLSEPATQFYGDREGRVLDPFGYVWSLMTHVEDVSPEEMQKRAAEAAASGEWAQ